MGKIKIHSGDFSVGSLNFTGSEFTFHEPGWLNTHLPVSEIIELHLATEENVKKIGGTLISGAVGGVILGPLGLFAGLMVGGNKKESTFIAVFRDGRQMLATADTLDFSKIQAIFLETSRKNPPKMPVAQSVPAAANNAPCWSCGRASPTVKDKCPYCKVVPDENAPPCWNCGKMPGDSSRMKCAYCKS